MCHGGGVSAFTVKESGTPQLAHAHTHPAASVPLSTPGLHKLGSCLVPPSGVSAFPRETLVFQIGP